MATLNILVTGGCGYIGTHVVKALLAAGHHPIIIDNLSGGHSHLLPGGEFFKCDIQDRWSLDQIFITHRIDAVMHFAGFIEVAESARNPIKYYRNNVAATASLFDAMVAYGIRRCIFSSSAAVYGEPLSPRIDEGHPLRPTSPYGETKRCVENMLSACDQAHGLKSICLRYFNAAGADESATIGERHNPESHLIPLILQAAGGERDHIRIFGTDYPTQDGTCVRDYVHVNDLASAHLLSLEHLIRGGDSDIFNVGNSQGYSVRQVIETAATVTGRPIKVIEDARRPGDPAVLVADANKIRTRLGWTPQYEDLTRIIRTAWNWHQISESAKPLAAYA